VSIEYRWPDTTGPWELTVDFGTSDNHESWNQRLQIIKDIANDQRLNLTGAQRERLSILLKRMP